MFGWLPSRKSTPTATKLPGSTERAEGDLKTPHADGIRAFPIDAEALKPHPILSILPRGKLQTLLSGPGLAEHPKGTVIFREGDPCDAVYLIVSGRCESLVQTREGPTVDRVLGPGDTLGERAFLNREPYRSTVVVATRCVLLRIPGEELQGLFARDARFAGRFAHAVAHRPEVIAERAAAGARVRRVVSFQCFTAHVDIPLVIRHIAERLHRVSRRKVLLVRLDANTLDGPGPDWTRSVAHFNGSFFFTRHLRGSQDGVDELHLSTGGEPHHAAAIAPLLSHCGRHYDFVLLEIRNDPLAPSSIACTIEADLAFVLLEPTAQGLADFRRFTDGFRTRASAAAARVHPVVFANEATPIADLESAVGTIAHPVHSFVRGHPLATTPSWSDHRYELWLGRLAREIARCRVGLALSSGAAKGLAHIGVLQVLEENGIEVDCIAGASMGAYVGSIWACGLNGQALEKIAREHEGRWGLFSLVEPAFPPRRGFFHSRRTAARLRRSIGNARFSEVIRPLRVIATRIATLERVVFSSGEVASAVEASIAIPGVVVPVTIDGETYLDGGVSDPLPVDVLEEMGIERIIAVNVNPPPEKMREWQDARRSSERKPHRSSLPRLLNQHLNYMADGNIIDVMMQAVAGAQMRVSEAAARHADVLLRPISGNSRWHDFTHPQRYIALGRSVAEAQLSELKALALPTPHDPPPPQITVAERPTIPA